MGFKFRPHGLLQLIILSSIINLLFIKMTKNLGYLYKLFNLKNKVVILTGGLGKIGTEYTEALVNAGAKVAIFDITSSPNEKLSKLAKKFPIKFFEVNITIEQEVIAKVRQLKKDWGGPSILINNAGWKPSPDKSTMASVPFEDYPMETWDEVFKINTTGAAICSKIIGGSMIKNKKGGVIINIASHYAMVSPDQRIYEYKEKKGQGKFIKDASYSASKAALYALTRDLATQWAKYGIRVNAFTPGGVFNNGDPEFLAGYSYRTPLGRMARVDEYNGAIIFLASNASSYMTGANLIMDGGWTAW